MHDRMAKIKDYFLFKNNEDFAELLNTKESRIKYLFSKAGDSAKFKEEEIKILSEDHFFNKEWLICGAGEMINETAKSNSEFLKEFNKLPLERQEYYYLMIKAENLTNQSL